jgi:hypothetical protein
VAHGWYDVNLIIKILYDRDFIWSFICSKYGEWV